MKKIKNIFKRIPYLVQINRQRLKVQNSINQQWSRLLRLIFNRICFDPTDIFLQFSPNSPGPYKERVALTIKTINNIFPFLGVLLQSTGRRAALPVDIKNFPKDQEDRQSSLTLKELFELYGSDKANPHNYYWLYGSILKDCQSISSVLEIGIGTDNTDIVSHMGAQGSPGASLRAFRDFLPHAEIYGADIDRRALFTEDRIKTFFVDQTDLASFKNINTFLPGELDLIIDDGLHSPDANINTLNFALTKVKTGGWVVIEDIRCEATPVWTVVSCILPEKFECHLLEADRGFIFAVQRKR